MVIFISPRLYRFDRILVIIFILFYGTLSHNTYPVLWGFGRNTFPVIWDSGRNIYPVPWGSCRNIIMFYRTQ